jgi:hypothetical protein
MENFVGTSNTTSEIAISQYQWAAYDQSYRLFYKKEGKTDCEKQDQIESFSRETSEIASRTQ